jgi:hypothetical protein
MALRVLIDGVDVTRSVGPVSYVDQLNMRSKLRLPQLVVDDDSLQAAGVDIVEGEAIELRDVRPSRPIHTSDGAAIHTSDGAPLFAQDYVVRFGGTIERAEYVLGDVSNGEPDRYSVDAVSFDELADRHVIAKVYENVLAGDIIRDVIALKLAADGVTAAAVEDGPLIEFLLVDYWRASDVFRKVQELTGMITWIDARRVCHFHQRTHMVAPLEVSIASRKVANLRVTRSRERYRNIQIIRGGHDLTDLLTERFVGDGVQRTWNVAFPIGAVPTVTVNDVEQTVGIRGVENGKDWFWSKDETAISQDDGAPPLEAGDELAVTYRGLFKVIVVVQDDAEVAARQALQGGSGRYERVADEPNIDSAAVVAETAIAYLQRDGRVPNILMFDTLDEVRAGVLVPVHLPEHGMVDQFLVTAVSARYLAGDQFLYTITVTDGGHLGAWVQYFIDLAAKQRAAQARQDEILIAVRTLPAAVRCGVTLDLLAQPPASQIGVMAIGTGEIAA